MKSASQSTTMRGAALALAAAVVAAVVGILVYADVLDAAGAALVTGLVTPIIGAAGALMAAYGRCNPLIKPLTSRSRAAKGVPKVLLILPVLLSLAVLGGCGSTFHCSKSYERQLKPSKPFTDSARCDGEDVFSASGPIKALFRVKCPDGQRPIIARDGIVSCEVAP